MDGVIYLNDGGEERRLRLDPTLAMFASEMGPAWEIFDLRRPPPGDGFSWDAMDRIRKSAATPGSASWDTAAREEGVSLGPPMGALKRQGWGPAAPKTCRHFAQ